MKRMPGKEFEKTLIVLSPGFPRDEADSNCLPSQQIFIKALNREFPWLHITIISFQYPFEPSTYGWNGNLVIALGGKNKGKLRRLLTWMKAWTTLVKTQKKKSVIGILSFWCSECALIGKLFGQTYGLTHFSWILGQDARQQNKFVKWIRPEAGRLVAMSGFLADEFYKSHGIRPAHVVQNGVDASEYIPFEGPRDLDVLGVGSLTQLKQYAYFMKVAKSLADRMPEIKCVLCGAGPEASKLNKMVQELSLGQNVQLCGEQPHHIVLKLMSRTKIFLHPSSYEGFSSVCLEALYAGAQVISFWSPQMGKITNWHVVANPEEMIQKAVDLLGDPAADYRPILVQSIGSTAIEMMNLFGIGNPMLYQ
jgi:glycosyltransferase involved in cell wall biosynthesis